MNGVEITEIIEECSCYREDTDDVKGRVNQRGSGRQDGGCRGSGCGCG